MKKLPFTFLFTLIFFITIQAQDAALLKADLQKNNPFTEARYNFFKKTIIIFNEYLDTDNGSFNTLNLRALLPVGNKAWQLRADVPLISTNTSSLNQTGFGDFSFAVSYIPYLKNKKGIGLRGRIFANSAQDPSFGTGKWVFAPTFFYGQYLNNKKKLLWLSNLEYQFSFAGSSNRDDISTAISDNSIVFNFNKNWIAGNITFRYKTIDEGINNSAYIEFGRKFTSDALFYIHPSIAFGDKRAYNYGMELGLLIYY